MNLIISYHYKGYKQEYKTNNQTRHMEEVNSKKNYKYKFSTLLKKNYKIKFYVHFLWTIDGPDSSYSSFLIHISSNVLNDDKIEPPIHTEYFLSGGAIILMVIESGANALISFCTLSGIP
eukprot:TRINITY_DN165_c0_g1_i5.p1 TRINITY_DN165_c0_g1~~TRINITY_DN165_c0_g1_i5.p1  ORF type:complete len:120 (+),score=6.41 TRINITY_DN165_c0_g1_i5:186-545(+)